MILTEPDIRRIIGQPTNAYDTHRPLLAEAIIHTTGPILELGMGDGSTPGLHEIAMRTGRRVVSYENDAQWFARYRHLAKSPHSLRLVSSYEDAFFEEPWGVALVDHGVAERRARDIGRLAKWAEIVVMHDTEDPQYRYWTLGSMFKYSAHDLRRKPWTRACSNTINLSEWPKL